ncbi:MULTISPECIES: metal ABC transporter ATP-binding protein [unclassified Micromonospora]|uniref:metal ABC transporter ATP-binding protein n=1 Tax=unclassified Micromonospora TaxID=2617518 RepID=UPI0010334FFB|nr:MULTISPECIES: metal ABC transporter ATP-binding protein [unclassified Micromonospora]QKW16393.1 metal ABC transporter ATP-binding protein [Verrucosispora sp. NA02020]TBL28511.1 metal ABC transporter ATP-binding protein [Verrucosispora sp. SN26_14.1]
MTPDVITVEHGVVGYDGRPVLRDVSLTVTTGEVVAVLGANGSGKSTLIRAVLGLVPLTAGSITLFGQRVRRFRQWQRLGYVPQRLGAGSGVPATVAEVVASGRLARRGILRPPGRVDREAVAEALRAVGLADRAKDPVATLSGGQQQRTLIARALAGRPELLVLDEPTAGVDAASQEAFAGALRGFVDDGGTVLLVAHELGPLRPLISRAIVVHQGQIAHDGAVPDPAGHHAEPDHDHVHPHGPEEPAGMWSTR